MIDEEEKELKKRRHGWAYSNIDIQNYKGWSLDEYLEYHESSYALSIGD